MPWTAREDFKPANLMLCKIGLVKLTDFGESAPSRSHEVLAELMLICTGLAAFSSTVDIDPWTQEQPEGGQLSTQLVGGIATYFSPEQVWLKSALAKVKLGDEQEYIKLKRRWVLTPCVSDLFQAGKTVLEMYARPNKAMKGSWKSTPVELLRKCMSRTPAETVRAMAPADAEAWVVHDLGLSQFTSKLATNGIDGATLLAFPSMSLKEQNSLLKVNSTRHDCVPAQARDTFDHNRLVLLLCSRRAPRTRPR